MTGTIYTKRVKSITEKVIPKDNTYSVKVLSWHAKQSEYHMFSPFYLKTDGNEENVNIGGVIFENFWQGSKLFSKVFSCETYAHYTKKGDPKYLTWKYNTQNGEKGEEHINLKTGEIEPEYYTWRNAVFANKCAVRYPNGRNNRKLTQFTLLIKKDKTQERLNYLDARKHIYVKEYMRLIKKLPEYKKLLDIMKSGKDICIFEIDVPSIGKKGLYGKCVDKDGYYKADKKTIDELMDDTSEPFGHGLCIAKSLLEDT